jgi:hypothetical protein
VRILGQPPSRTIPEEILARVIGIPASYLPDAECFAEGLGLFRERRLGQGCEGRDGDGGRDGGDGDGDGDGRVALPRRLLLVGAAIWRERREAEEEEEDGDAGGAPADSGGGAQADDGSGQTQEATADLPEAEVPGPTWDPERVAATLDGIVCHGAALARRAGWLTWLSESTVAWAETRGGEARDRVLVFERGRIVDRLSVAPGDALPPPPGRHRSRRERQESFDVATYDRLRIVSTELRRLVQEVERVRVRLGSGPTRGPREVATVLGWI